MPIHYNDFDDVLFLRLSDQPVSREVSYGENVTIAYSAEGQPVAIALLEVIGQRNQENARACEVCDTPIVLTERESRWLAERIDSPPPRSERWLAAMARHREHLRANEPAIDTDECAWMAHQARLLGQGRLNPVQSEILTAFFEEQVAVRHREFEAWLRRLLIELTVLEPVPDDRKRVDRVADLRAQVRCAIAASPSLGERAASRLAHVWREACLALKQNPHFMDGLTELPTSCPYTMEQIVGKSVPAIAGEGASAVSEVPDRGEPVISHITPVGGNIFLDLGFSPEEAARLKEESDQRIAARKGECDT